MAQRLDASNVQGEIRPTCQSVDGIGAPLEINKQRTQGWGTWKLPPAYKKEYWRTTELGSVITFDMDLTVGKM